MLRRVAALDARCGRSCTASGPAMNPPVDARHQRVRAQAVRAVDGVVGFAAGVEALDVGLLVEVHPQPAHGVVHAGEDLHGHIARIVAHELLVDFEDAFELAVERGAVDVRQVEIDHRLAVDAEVVLVHDLVDGAGGDVARHQVAVLGIPLFQEVPALALGNALEIALVARLSSEPTRGHLRRGPTPTSGAACLRRECMSGAPG